MPFPMNEFYKFKMLVENENNNNTELNNNNGSSLFGHNYNNADIYVDSYLYKQQASNNNTGLFGYANQPQNLFGQSFIPNNSIFSSINNQGVPLFSNNNIFGNTQTSPLFQNNNNIFGNTQTGSLFPNNNNIFGNTQTSSLFSNATSTNNESNTLFGSVD